MSEEPTETVEPTEPPAAAPASQRPRRAKAAPAVLFQPPEPDRPLPRQPRRAPTEVTTDTSAQLPEPPKARTTSVRKAAPRKAAETPTEVTPTTPAPRKRAASPTRRAVSPRKTTTPTNPTPEPVAEPQMAPAAPAVRQAEPALGRTPESELRAVAARVLDHPGFAPELLALAAVRAFGPGAALWALGLRTRYPDASADGLARLATRRFVRSAGAGGATAALAGFFAPLAELATVLWTHSELVLHLAAAYGKDPTHPDRAVDLLVLTQVHPDRVSAAAALAAAESAADPIEGAWPRAAEAAWRLAAPLTAQAGGWAALRLVARLLPGAAVLAAALGDSAAADRLAARAVAVYRPDRR